MARPSPTSLAVGDRVRLRDGALPWIGKRDGWTVKDAYDGYDLIREGGPATVHADREDVEPEAPSPWAPTPGSDMRQAVTEAISEASVAWYEDGVFDDEAALRVADGLVTWLTEAHGQNIEPVPPVLPPEPPLGSVVLDCTGEANQRLLGGWYELGGEDGRTWEELNRLGPLTPLYPVPDPDDGRAVNDLWFSLPKTFLGGLSGVRDVLRVLRGDA